MPNKLPDRVTPVALFVITAAGNCASGTTPLTWLTGSVPDKPPAVPARMAYGVGRTCWRGASVVKLPPFFCTLISNQRGVPSN